MSINSVLVANRGEIACRLIRAIRAEGLRAVAVFSETDRGAPHVRLADLAVEIGPGPAAESYLDPARILDAASKSGANAIHPGYGFLAENADFAQACEDAGLVFIGPTAEHIRLMGSKIAAKAAAEQAGVPVVPGYYSDDQADARLEAETARIGMPLMIKASAGGGGRGMRVVRDLADFQAELATARAEARAAFGDDAVLLERLVTDARHVEVQVLGDAHGHVLHLWERDCSLQRNHQKIIEEAPAPNLPEAARRGMLEDAVKLARAIGYRNAGTVEYLFDPASGAWYFLEMNTRLQVEHPVTEAITGIDIARWQLRIAQGAPLDLSQEEIPCNGWAIEARIAAENPAEGFRPETGRLTRWSPPELEGLRLDSGVGEGSLITHHYDSMLAKLIAQADSREGARRRLLAGLEHFAVAGVGANLAFLADLLRLPEFTTGRHDTGTLARHWPESWTPPASTPRHQALAVLARFLAEAPAGSPNPWQALGGWRLLENAGRPGRAVYFLDGEAAAVVGRAGIYRIELPGGEAHEFEGAALEDGRLAFEEEGMRRAIPVTPEGARITLHEGPGGHVLRVLSGAEAFPHGGTAEAEDGGDGQLRAPMPGAVIEHLVAPGDRVEAGDPVIVIEAMKMMQTLVAPCAGTVGSLPHAPGESVEGGALLAIIAPAEPDTQMQDNETRKGQQK